MTWIQIGLIVAWTCSLLKEVMLATCVKIRFYTSAYFRRDEDHGNPQQPIAADLIIPQVTEYYPTTAGMDDVDFSDDEEEERRQAETENAR